MNLMKNIELYLKDIKSEWGKITWPNRHQIFVYTFIVLCIVIIFSLITYFLDVIFNFVLESIPK